jgi:hypothetical protein
MLIKDWRKAICYPGKTRQLILVWSLEHRKAITKLINAKFWHAIFRLKFGSSDRGARVVSRAGGSGLPHSVNDNQPYYFNYKIIINMQRTDGFLDCNWGLRPITDGRKTYRSSGELCAVDVRLFLPSRGSSSVSAREVWEKADESLRNPLIIKALQDSLCFYPIIASSIRFFTSWLCFLPVRLTMT